MASDGHEATERWLLAYVRERVLSPGAEVPTDARTTVFSSLGLNSVGAVQMVAALSAWLGREVDLAAVYENPTIAALASSLHAGGASRKGARREVGRAGPAAIVGIGCRVADLSGPAAFWSALCDARSLIAPPGPARQAIAQHVRWRRLNRPERCFEEGGFLTEVAGFDAAFFGISAAEACRIDPQQRFLLEICYDALLDAGVAPGSLAGTNTGVYVGLAGSDYGAEQLQHPEAVDVFTNTGSVLSIAANRISYQLDLHGPSMTLDTACSSSAVAIHQACVDLALGSADLAIVGGANLMLSPEPTLGMALAGVMAADARCKSFDKRGDGYVRAEGAGVVILKPFDRALADGDRIYAVVGGSSTNHSGRTNGLMSPSGSMQAAVLRSALRAAGVKPRQVDYLEAHATGTFIGDPIELNALGEVLAEGVGRTRKCRIGSVKSQVGHLEAAAGIVGVIKTALCLHHRTLLGQVNYETPNPKIAFDRLPIEVSCESTPWPGKKGQACASVASVGFGGTNCNIILVEAGHRSLDAARPAGSQAPSANDTAEEPLALMLSAHSDHALLSLAKQYLVRLDGMNEGDVAECRAICGMATHCRDQFAHRLAAVGRTVAELRVCLRNAMESRHQGPPDQKRGSAQRSGLVYVFSGQGGQWPEMGRGLWSSDPRGPFRTAFERCDEAVRRLASYSPIECLLDSNAAGYLLRIDRLQPVLFCFQVALAELLSARGASPSAVVGHSMGELAAAYVAGGLDLDDAVRVIVTRSQLLRGISRGGAMVVTDLTQDSATEFIRGSAGAVSIAACNSPASTVLSGESRAIAEICRTLTSQGAFAKVIKVDVAAHSACVDPLTGPLQELLGRLKPKQLQIPMYSTVVDRFVVGKELDAAYWVANLRQPVLLVQAVAALARVEPSVFIELSPHPVLLDGLRASLEQPTATGDAFACCQRERDEVLSVWQCLCELYKAGISLNVRASRAGANWATDWRPGHPWQHQRYWWQPEALEAGARPTSQPSRAAPGPVDLRWHPLLGEPTSIGTQPSLHVWEIDPGTDAAQILRDHRVGGDMVFPAAAILELAASAAARISGSAAIHLKDVQFARLLSVKEGAGRVQLILQEALLREERSRAWSFRVCVLRKGGTAAEWKEVTSGTVAVETRDDGTGEGAGPGQPVNIDRMMSTLREVPGGSAFYQRIDALGIHYGPLFQVVGGLWIDRGAALARLIPHPEAVGEEPRYRIHPAILDGALQTALATLGDEPARRLSIEGRRPLPGCVRSVRFWRPRQSAGGPDVYWSVARLSVSDTSDVLTFDVDLLDRAGAPLVAIRGLEVIPSAGVESSRETYRIAWRPVTLREPAREPVDDNAGGLAPRRLFCSWEPSSDICMALVRLVQEVAELGGPGPPTLYIATSGARTFTGDRPPADEREMAARAAQAGLWGLARTVAAEHPMLALHLVDLEPGTGPIEGTEWLRRNVSLLDEHRELIVRNDCGYVPVLEPWVLPENNEPASPVHPDAAYLVVGGAGALGSIVVNELVSAGAGAVWMAGRRSHPPPEAAARIERARQIGCDARYVTCDVSVCSDVETVLQAIQSAGRPLRGIVSCAGELDDRPVASMTAASMERVMAAKRDGAWYLHRASRDVDLDFFVVFSSAAALIGSPGQGNYAAANASADGICQVRNAAGKAALTINWGPWSGVGLAAPVGRGDRLQELGVGSFSPAEGAALFREILRSRARGQIVAARLDARVLASSNPAGASLGLPGLGRDAPSSAGELEAWLTREIATILRVSPGSVRPESSFQDLGVGSLALLHLKGRIERSLRIHLPASIIWKHPTIGALAARIAMEVSRSSRAGG